MRLLDGTLLAKARADGLLTRAGAVTRVRGRAPTLAIIAFGRAGAAPWLDRKLTACAAAGVAAVPLIIGPRIHPAAVAAMIGELIMQSNADGVFLQIPCPAGLDERPLIAMIPEDLDVDVMSAGRVRAYFADRAALPPVTVTAALDMLAAYDVDVRGRRGIVIADESPFALMLAESLSRAGASMAPLVAPRKRDLSSNFGGADLIISAAGRPKLVNAADIAPGSIVIDAGYFNPRGIGDIDVTSGVDHLDAFGPVPGGIGPMTISALIDRVILFAETANNR